MVILFSTYSCALLQKHSFLSQNVLADVLMTGGQSSPLSSDLIKKRKKLGYHEWTENCMKGYDMRKWKCCPHWVEIYTICYHSWCTRANWQSSRTHLITPNQNFVEVQ